MIVFLRASTPDTEPTDSEGSADKGFDPEVILLNLREKLVAAPKGRKATFQLGPGTQDLAFTAVSFTE